MSTDTNSVNEQQSYLKDRVRNLEGDLDRALREKTDAVCEVRRLTSAKEHLVLLVVEAEVSNEEDGLMQELFAVLLIGRGLHRVEEDVVEQVVQLLLHLIFTHDLLGKSIVHAEDVIYNLD